MKKKKSSKIIIEFCAFIIGMGILIFSDDITTYLNSDLTSSQDSESTSLIEGEDLQIYFLDVGQADSILIRLNDENMLIDAGNNADGDKLVTYFESLGITKFKYVVGTHAHEDHIGGMDNIIENFDIDTFYMPDVITTTATFEDVLDSLSEKSIYLDTPSINDTFKLGTAVFNVLYVGTNAKELNDTSIVLSMKYGSKTYLFTGDATDNVEKEILSKNIKADVLKVAHHGSQYSTTEEFLDKVNPTYAIISVGLNNTYNHPNDVTIKKLNDKNIEIYRTDESGTILLTSNGNDINIETLKTETNG